MVKDHTRGLVSLERALVVQRAQYLLKELPRLVRRRIPLLCEQRELTIFAPSMPPRVIHSFLVCRQSHNLIPGVLIVRDVATIGA